MIENEPHLEVVLHDENPNCRTYYVRRRFYATRDVGLGTNEPVLSLSDERLRPGDFAVRLARRLETVPGVVGCQFRLYSVTVLIGGAFRWKDVGPKVAGELVKMAYPNIAGRMLEVSVRAAADSQDRAGYREIPSAQSVEVDFGTKRPVLEIEHILLAAANEAKKAPAPEKPGTSHASTLHAA